MRTIWLIMVPLLMGSIESSAMAQLIPRRHTTRPCPTYQLPQAKYEVDDRSGSVEAFSFRFVYPGNPLDVLNQQPNAGLTEKTEITTITTEKEVSGGNSDATGLTGLAAEVSEATSVIDDARIAAQKRLIETGPTAGAIAAAREALRQARFDAEAKIRESGMTSDNISDAITALESAGLDAEEKLLTAVKGSAADISKVKAQQSLVKEQLLKSGKIFTLEAARLRAKEKLLAPGKTAETIKKKTQVFENTPDSVPATVQRDQKLFQWKENRLRIDHCEISNMAVKLSRSGEWRLNLRADQNRRVPNQRFNPTLHIKRNQFGIVLRCYGNMATSRKVSSLTVGQPVLAELKVEKFWVQNGRPNFFVTSEKDPLIAKHFDSIDRVAIEFFYYK